jgi:phosphomevalonate kinase
MITQAPGKVMIAGEYSVLMGFPALVAAIDRVAICQFKEGPALNFFAKTSQEFSLLQNSPLFLAVLTTFKKHRLEPRIGEYFLDTSEFFDATGQKIGLGSSAAAATALSRMILLQHEIEDQALLFERAHEAHRLFSGGVGSGADIAAAVYGGMLLYQQGIPSPRIINLDRATIWPKILVIHTGKAQNTAHFVEKFLHFKGAKSLIDNFNAEQSKCVEELLANLDKLDVFIRVINQLFELLDILGTSVGIDIVSKEHRLIASLAQSLGGAAKPSGAGGGDIAIACVPNAYRGEFRSLLEQSGFFTIE